MPLSVVASRAGSRTDSGCRSGLRSTSSGQRKSFHDAMTAKTETTPRIGLLIGSTIDQKSRNGPAPSIWAASKISRGRLSKNRGDQHDVERARARRQPHRPVRVDQRVIEQRRVEDDQVERHQQHDGRHEQRGEHEP